MMPSALTLPSYQLAQLQQAAAAAATSVGNSFGLGTGAMPASKCLDSFLYFLDLSLLHQYRHATWKSSHGQPARPLSNYL